MDRLNPDIPAPDLTDALHAAARSLTVYDKGIMTPELLLLSLIRGPEFPAHRILGQFSAERGFALPDLEREVEGLVRSRVGRTADFGFQTANGDLVALSDEMLVVLDEGRAIARAMDEIYVGTSHALAAMSQRGVSTSGLLQRYGITPSAMSHVLADQALSGRFTTVDLVAQAREGELSPVYFREEPLRLLLSLLALTGHRHVLLLGPPGVGKRSLIYSLALLMAEGKGPPGLAKLVAVSETALVDDAAQAVRSGLRQADNGILFLPNIHRFFGGLVRADFPKATRHVQKALLSDRVVVIGTAPQIDYDERLANDPAIAEHVHLLPVSEPSEAETAAILARHRPRLETDYGISIGGNSLVVTASLARRFLSSTPLPASAVQLLHRACALVRMGQQTHMAFRPNLDGDARLDEEDVTLAASLMTGIPASKLSTDERSRYARMVDHLHERIVGQEEAVLAVSRAVKTARVGLKDPKRPIGSFLFLGPTGVGKTELAKALAEFLFGTEEDMVVLDMSEYQQEHSVSRLIGAPPGYVGYEGGGQLTERLRVKPYTVVLLDEVEKAHARVLDVLLQIMDEGRLTDGQGHTVLFSEAVVIMTSNLGAEFLETTELTDRARGLVMAQVRRFFRPEFLNRLDEIVLFLPLNQEELKDILDLMLKGETQLLANRGLRLEVTEAAKAWLLGQNSHPEWGARPLRRIIQRHLREPMADHLLAHSADQGTTVHVDAAEDGLHFCYCRFQGPAS